MNNIARGEIYWANLKPVKGSEQGGSRPVLIVSNNLMNQTSPVVLVVPMTTSGDKVNAGIFNQPYEIQSVDLDEKSISELKEKGHEYESIDGVILCNQARAISKNRILGRVGKFKDRRVIKRVNEAIIHSFSLDACEDCEIPLRPNGLFCANCKRVYRKKCVCSFVMDVSYDYCPKCGRGV